MISHIIVKKKTIISLMLAFIFAVFSTVEILGIGPDRTQYQYFFDRISLDDFDSRYEFGFEYMAIFFKIIFGNIGFILFVFAMVLIALVLKFNFLAKRKDWPILISLYVLCVMLLHEFIQIRVSVAMAFCMLSVAEASKETSSFFKKTVYFLIATSFHNTSFFFIPFVFFNNFFRAYNRFYIFLFIILSFLVGFFIKAYISQITGGAIDAYLLLMEQSDDRAEINTLSARNIALMLTIIIGIIRVRDINKFTLPYFYISLSGLAFFFGLLWFPLMANRIIELTMISTIAWSSDIRKDYRVVVYLILLIFGFYYSYNLLELFE